jgi:broad specificity phosphatase PhoE
MQEIYYVRHGQSVAQEQRKTLGKNHVSLISAGLSKTGCWQAKQLQNHDCIVTAQLVVVSPLIRALQTAAISASKQTIPIICHPLLRERGNWSENTPVKLSDMMGNVPGVASADFSLLGSKWPKFKRLTSKESAEQFQTWVSHRPERKIVVISHGRVLQRLLHTNKYIHNCVPQSLVTASPSAIHVPVPRKKRKKEEAIEAAVKRYPGAAVFSGHRKGSDMAEFSNFFQHPHHSITVSYKCGVFGTQQHTSDNTETLFMLFKFLHVDSTEGNLEVARRIIAIDRAGNQAGRFGCKVSKIKDLGQRKYVFVASSASDGKRQKLCTRLPDSWDNGESMKAMMYCLRAKFQQVPEFRKQLLGTGQRVIVEASHWDNIWGSGLDGSGQNKLGKCLMQLRNEHCLSQTHLNVHSTELPAP